MSQIQTRYRCLRLLDSPLKRKTSHWSRYIGWQKLLLGCHSSEFWSSVENQGEP